MRHSIGLLRQIALETCHVDKRFQPALMDEYIDMVETVGKGNCLLPFRPVRAERRAAIPFERLFDLARPRNERMHMGTLNVSAPYFDELRALFTAWHENDAEAARASLQALTESEFETRVEFDDSRHTWALRVPRTRGPFASHRYVLYASTKWGTRDKLSGAFVSRDMALAHEIQHRFMHPDILVRFQQLARIMHTRTKFYFHQNCSELVAMSYENELAHRSGLVARISHESGGFVAAADLRRQGLQLPYRIGERSEILTAGKSVCGVVVASNRCTLVLRNACSEYLTFDTRTLAMSLVRGERLRVQKGASIRIAIAEDPPGYWDADAARFLRIPTTACTVSQTETRTRWGIQTVGVQIVR